MLESMSRIVHLGSLLVRGGAFGETFFHRKEVGNIDRRWDNDSKQVPTKQVYLLSGKTLHIPGNISCLPLLPYQTAVGLHKRFR